ncbi:type I asparaginase [Leptobacterium flavescens]|uniref:asparaginase n=1 Tax=Leptobacterium flavescens TaxID=472055 RepID=A0A6P0ULH0_9FLAO|nr:asparaginase [Leptobacterium flavescens]NER12739.1 type I asparaginase [Leptobacterium flavescens]
MGNRSKILLIYTGGTIGMVKDYETGALKAFDFDKLQERIPELSHLDCDIQSVSFSTPIDSSNMSPEYWVQIAGMIEDHYKDFDGFVVLHGSDTMSYSASALSFMLENLAKPVIFTGSQLPIGDLRTDAKENLITSIQIASLRENNKPVVKEVGVYFEYKLYRGNRTTKINAEHFNAFASLNYPALGESGVHLNINHEYLLKPAKGRKLIVHKELNNNIAVVKLFPGTSESALACVFNNESIRAIVLETYGSGNAFTHEWFYDLIESASKRGVFIVNVTQCSGGSVIMGQYETSTRLKELGIINGKDITTEAAIAKLMYLLGSKIGQKTFKTIFETALRGEMS